MSLPDELVDKIKQAAGGEGQVSSYVATALADYQERESLDEILTSWRAEINLHVALCARDRHHAVVTSDPEDIARIDPTLGLIRA